MRAGKTGFPSPASARRSSGQPERPPGVRQAPAPRGVPSDGGADKRRGICRRQPAGGALWAAETAITPTCFPQRGRRRFRLSDRPASPGTASPWLPHHFRECPASAAGPGALFPARQEKPRGGGSRKRASAAEPAQIRHGDPACPALPRDTLGRTARGKYPLFSRRPMSRGSAQPSFPAARLSGRRLFPAGAASWSGKSAFSPDPPTAPRPLPRRPP